MSYIPPDSKDVDFKFGSEYTPPSSTEVDFEFTTTYLVLKRWTGTEWVNSSLKTYIPGYENKRLKIWTGTTWASIITME